MKPYLRFTLLLLCFSFTTSKLLTAQEDIFTDDRDGQQYRFISIGDQVWMAENLNFETENSWSYGDKKKNSSRYGKLYTWEAAQIACPGGWHLPSEKEWQVLINYFGGDRKAGMELRTDGTSSFDAEFGGFKNKDGEYMDLGKDANFWTSISCDEEDAWRLYIDKGFNSVVQDYFSKQGGLSVRCIKDN